MTLGANPRTIKLQVELTDDQARDFATCAEACGLDVHRWIVECAAAKAADVIDAIQAPKRTDRKQRPKRDRSSLKPDTLQAARDYNAKFKKRG